MGDVYIMRFVQGYQVTPVNTYIDEIPDLFTIRQVIQTERNSLVATASAADCRAASASATVPLPAELSAVAAIGVLAPVAVTAMVHTRVHVIILHVPLNEAHPLLFILRHLARLVRHIFAPFAAVPGICIPGLLRTTPAAAAAAPATAGPGRIP